jgi:hypothetical protein
LCCPALLLPLLQVKIRQARVGVSAEAGLSWQNPHAEPATAVEPANTLAALLYCFSAAGQDKAGNSWCVSIVLPLSTSRNATAAESCKTWNNLLLCAVWHLPQVKIRQATVGGHDA